MGALRQLRSSSGRAPETRGSVSRTRTFAALATPPQPTAARNRASSSTLVVVGEGASWFVREACLRARAGNEFALYCLYVGGLAGGDGRTLDDVAREARRYGVRLAPIVRATIDVAEAICGAAAEVDARVVIMEGVARRGVIARLRARRALRKVRQRLRPERTLIVYA